jgi:protein-S-isoprenylcysteine O-methyltransferase Ste14
LSKEEFLNPILRRIFQLLLLVFIQAALLFLSAGQLTWMAGWVYIGLYFICLILASVILLPHRKEVVAERSRGASGGKSWDVWLTRIMSIPALGLLVVAGLDERFGWQPDFGPIIQFIGCVLFLLGYSVVIWAMYTNQFFSSVVRIQTERDHVAVTGGPYHIVRHPGYVGMMTSALGGVLWLGSPWAMIPYGFYVVIVIVRTSLEDKTLQAELPGYAEYAGHTRYRLIPGIW